MKKKSKTKVKKLSEYQSSVQNDANPRQVQIHYEPLGSSGIENYAGYYQEEYLSTLQGRQRADLYDKMGRSDPKIKMLTSAVKNPIKAASWSIDPGDDSDFQKMLAEKMSHIIFDDLDKPWTQLLHEILSMINQGYSMFEMIDKVVFGHKKFGNYNGLASLGFRSQRTIERFNLDHSSGKLLSVDQYAYGDLQRLVTIPSEFLLTFVMDKEGDNYEGISWLRPCVGPYKRKDHHLKQEAIGIEKYAIPTPTLEVPDDKQNSAEYATAVAVLKKYITHEQQFITYPKGWKIDFLKNDFDAQRIRAIIKEENVEMVHAFLANFLELGQSGSGSYALSFDLSDFFLGSIEHIAKLICEQFNRTLIQRMVKLNHGPQEVYPKLRCTGISDKAGKEFAEILKLVIDSKVVIPDDAMEADIRKRYNLTVKSDQGQREVQPQSQFRQFQEVKPLPMSESVKLAEPKKQIKDDREVLKDYMQEQLQEISDSMIDQIMVGYRNLSPSQRLDAIKGVAPKGQQDYQRQLKELLASFATKALDQARKEVPKKKNVRLSETVLRGTLKLSEFELLPLEIQKRLNSLSQLLVGTQIGDLQKNLGFTYLSSIESTDSESLIESDLNEASDKFVLGPSVETGAGNITAQVINDARNAFFFDDSVSQEIESFTFVNGDPVSPICQDLAGTVFAKDDPNVDRYWPPLHHNCKSYIVPNLVDRPGNPPLTEGGLKPSKSSLEKYVTLAESTSDGLLVQSIVISKKYAINTEDAKRIAFEYRINTENAVELETGYKFIHTDPSLIEEGTLKSFEPMEGVTLFVGMPKKEPLALAEGNWKLQTIIISKSHAKSIEEAINIAKEVGATTTDKVDETENSYRFRQREPSDFIDSSFRTKAVEQKGVSLVYGRLKP